MHQGVALKFRCMQYNDNKGDSDSDSDSNVLAYPNPNPLFLVLTHTSKLQTSKMRWSVQSGEFSTASSECAITEDHTCAQFETCSQQKDERCWFICCHLVVGPEISVPESSVRPGVGALTVRDEGCWSAAHQLESSSPYKYQSNLVDVLSKL